MKKFQSDSLGEAYFDSNQAAMAFAKLAPRYCDIIVKRWETLTGKHATRFPV